MPPAATRNRLVLSGIWTCIFPRRIPRSIFCWRRDAAGFAVAPTRDSPWRSDRFTWHRQIKAGTRAGEINL